VPEGQSIVLWRPVGPAENLDDFNAALVSDIEVIAAFS